MTELLVELFGGGADLVVELPAHLPRRKNADDRGEPREDHERQSRRAASEPPANRQRPIRGERSPRRGSYVGAEALHRLQASFGDWIRTLRSCWSSRTGHTPRPRQATAGAR